LATKKKPAVAKKTNDQPVVTRITASDTKPKKTTPKTPPAVAETSAPKPSPLGRIATPFVALGGYFKGAWYELKQVRWPNRKATWGLTAAVIGFTAVFTVIILLLDAVFKYLFQLMLG
jgi:preprotein translocase subunit SecE